jgi:hypothetical protein
MKTSVSITILIVYSIIMAIYIRYNVIANMNDSYVDGCFDAAQKIAIDYKDLSLYDFCKARKSFLDQFTYE